MKISEKLLQFNKKSLLVVAGRRMAYFYCVFNGEANKIDSIEMDSDKKGFFKRLSRDKFFRSGSALEEKKTELDRKFFKEVKDKTEAIFRKDNIEDIYLFASDHVEKGLPEALSNDIRSRIIFSFRGNFIRNHLFDLIKKIQNTIEGKKPKFISETAMRILKRKK